MNSQNQIREYKYLSKQINILKIILKILIFSISISSIKIT